MVKIFTLFIYFITFFLAQDEDKFLYIKTELTNIGFSEEKINSIIHSDKLEDYPNIINKFIPSGNSTDPLITYESLFLSDDSIEEGEEFIDKNNNDLQEVENHFNIPKEIVTAILRVESRFGNNIGSYQAAGALLSTVAYGESDSRIVRRAEREFVALMIMVRDTGMDPFEIKSSYAGAIGFFQFLPSSYLYYAIDGNNDGIIDPFNIKDSMWSIANYLYQNGWHRNSSQALFLYNNSHAYVDCIKRYAELIKNE